MIADLFGTDSESSVAGAVLLARMAVNLTALAEAFTKAK